MEELGRLYSPSCWSERYSAGTVVGKHVEAIRTGTAKARAELKTSLNVKYGTGGSGEAIDFYYPPTGSKESGSVLIFIHGGYWQDLEKDDYGLVALAFAKQGVTVGVVNFDNAPKGSMTTIVDQCRRASQFIAQTHKHSRIFLCGHSAGAHLCACLMATDWTALGMPSITFSGAFLISGIYDLEPISKTYVNEPLKLTEVEVRDYSPQRQLGALGPSLSQEFKCLLAHGEQESPAFKQQELTYYQGLRSVGVACDKCEVGGEDHFSVVERLMDEQYSLTRQILELINIPNSA